MRQSHFLSVVINACHCEPVWCSAQRIKILMTASGSHTLIYATLAWPFPSLPLRGGAPRSESKSNNCQWQLLNNVKVAHASPASARRMRATCLSLWERCPAGAERACLPSQSLRDSSPKVGAKGEENYKSILLFQDSQNISVLIPPGAMFLSRQEH